MKCVEYHEHEGDAWLRDSRPLVRDQEADFSLDVFLRRFFKRLRTEKGGASSLSNLFPLLRFWILYRDDLPVGRIAFFARDHDLSDDKTWERYNRSKLFRRPRSFFSGLSIPLPPDPPEYESSGLSGLSEFSDAPDPSEAPRAFFGFLSVREGEDEVAVSLLQKVVDFAYEHGFHWVDGPVTLHPFLGRGFLHDGSAQAPLFCPPWNPTLDRAATLLSEQTRESTAGHLEDLCIERRVTWGWQRRESIPPLAYKLAEATKAHPGLVFRAFEPHQPRDIQAIVDIYNSAHESRPQFVPLSYHDLDWVFRNTGVLDPRCSTMVELEGRPIAVVLAGDNMTPLKALEPEGVLTQASRRLYLNLIAKQDYLRVWTLALRPEAKGNAVGALFITLWVELLTRAAAAGYEHVISPATSEDDLYRVHGATLFSLTPERTLSVFRLLIERNMIE